MSPQPIPKYIERLALKISNEEAEESRKANTLEGAQAILDRLEAESEAAGFGSVKEYIEDLTRDPKGVKPPEGTTPTSAFWSHGIEHPEAPLNWRNENFLDNRYVAEAWARTQNKRHPGSAQTLETTEGGQQLNRMYLFEDTVREVLGGDEQGFTYEWARGCWASISETYAAAARGQVVVFAESAHTRSILYNQELPALHTNPYVGVDNVKFAYAPSKQWPEASRNEIGPHQIRAQVQVDDPSLPHYVDVAAYAKQDPVARMEALAAECSSVTAERNERAAEKAAATPTTNEAEVPEAEPPAIESPDRPPQPSARIPVWQVGFKPVPVKNEARATTSAATPTAPPMPDLGKQATGPGLE
ncbi:hypothetical protein [Streptomyces sp. DSM 40750]|uniref:hypothetical protein n=1 Tax=Streptomyces sp. DSM 40750 TaxID=2801030 RepID=UPI00214AA655|nr:hypothetical protein [Streptomyces sp. DSM 40750]UUU23833.1 hypothetical protein JIX55_28260 [Streptomyces sp. DSM 40750]